MDRRDEQPVACTLQGGSYRQRLAWIGDLAREGLRSHRRQDLVLDLKYAPEMAGRVRDMVRKEQDCCAFLNFDLTETADEVRLTITAPERARAVASTLFDEFVAAFIGSNDTPSAQSGTTVSQR